MSEGRSRRRPIGERRESLGVNLTQLFGVSTHWERPVGRRRGLRESWAERAVAIAQHSPV